MRRNAGSGGQSIASWEAVGGGERARGRCGVGGVGQPVYDDGDD